MSSCGTEDDDHQEQQLMIYDPSTTSLELERAAARARTSTSVVLQQLSYASAGIAEWVEYFTEYGNAYYYNEATGESRWTLPEPETLGLSLEGISHQLADGSSIIRHDYENAESDSESSTENNEESLVKALPASEDKIEVANHEVATVASSNHNSVTTTTSDYYTRRRKSLQAEAEEQARSERELEVARSFQRAREILCEIVEDALEHCLGEGALRARRQAEERQKQLRRGSRAQYRMNKKSNLLPQICATLDEEDESDNEIADVKQASDLQFDNNFVQMTSIRISNALRDVIIDTNLRILELSDCGLGDDDMPRIAQALGQSLVVHLFLNNNNIASPGVKALCPAAKTCPSLQELHLNSNRVGDEGVKALCTAFFNHSNLKVLNLAANQVSADGAKYLGLSMVQKQGKSTCCLHSLRLGACSENKSAFKTEEELQLIQSQRYTHEYIGNRGTLALAAALLVPGTVLISLSLCNCGIGADGARALAAMLYCEPPLRRLDLTENSLEGTGHVPIAATTGQRKLRAATLVAAQNKVPSPPNLQGKIKTPIMVPGGGVAAIARALEVTSTLRECLVSDIDLQKYINSLIHAEPPTEWRRRKLLGEDAANLREWLLDAAASNLNFTIPQGPSTFQHFITTNTTSEKNPMSERCLSETQKMNWNLLLTSLLNARAVDDSLIENFDLCHPPADTAWPKLKQAASVLDQVLTGAHLKADADDAVAAAAEQNDIIIQLQDTNVNKKYDAYTVLSEEIAQELEFKCAKIAVETKTPKLEAIACRQEAQIVETKKLCQNTKSALIQARTEAESRVDDLVLIQKQQQGVEDIRVLEARTASNAAANSVEQKQRLVNASHARLVVLQSARADTAKSLAKLHAEYALKLEYAKSTAILQQAEADEVHHDSVIEDMSFKISQAQTAAETKAISLRSIARKSRARETTLRSILHTVRTAAASRYETDLRSKLVPHPTGDDAIDGMLAEARLEQESALADLYAAEANLARSMTKKIRKSAIGYRVSARARYDAAKSKVKEACRDAAAVLMAQQQHENLYRTLAAHHDGLVHAVSPRNSTIAVPFASASVHTALQLEQQKQFSRRAREQAHVERKRMKAKLRSEVKSLRQLSPRSQLQTVTLRIDEARSFGYPTTRQGIIRLRKLRGCKARAKEALRKQRKQQIRPPSHSLAVDE